MAVSVWCHTFQPKNITSTVLQINGATVPTDEGITEQQMRFDDSCDLRYARKNTILKKESPTITQAGYTR